MANVGVNERLYRKRRLAFKAWCADQGLPCWICHRPIDYTAKAPPQGGSRYCFTLDHRWPRSVPGGPPPDDPGPEYAHWAPAHWTCNSSRGRRDVAIVRTATDTTRTEPHSEEWP